MECFCTITTTTIAHTNHTQQDTKPDERGTEQVPLIIKVLPPLNEEEKSVATKQERQDKSESDWWLVKLTGILAIIGFIQIVVFGLQAFRLRQTVDEMKIATQATEKAASAAEKSAEIARHPSVHRPHCSIHTNRKWHVGFASVSACRRF